MKLHVVCIETCCGFLKISDFVKSSFFYCFYGVFVKKKSRAEARDISDMFLELLFQFGCNLFI
ncbi:hypothetical protein BZG01_13210 [Labilibaculum manganireducens]|uniref:Uncharacterized protein n=1 Tax=Labilibaculum manganireducens TaxID=1940525 RepID=A0A2N3I522_9BACT|nr:hypothetical protein BZG01_13210 [Labilibaculum manganireducens]